jgi:hypothetical protein
LADQIGPLDTRKRGDRAIADALRVSRQSVERLGELLREVAESVDP